MSVRSNNRWELASTFFPREIRFSIAARPRRNAPAISCAPKPHRMLRMSPTCASWDSRGSQQENIIRSCSSRIEWAANASSTLGAVVHSLSSRRPISGAKVRAVRSRRTTSSARCFAVVMSHADGFSGMPRTFHTSSARQKAS